MVQHDATYKEKEEIFERLEKGIAELKDNGFAASHQFIGELGERFSVPNAMDMARVMEEMDFKLSLYYAEEKRPEVISSYPLVTIKELANISQALLHYMKSERYRTHFSEWEGQWLANTDNLFNNSNFVAEAVDEILDMGFQSDYEVYLAGVPLEDVFI